MKKIQRFMSQRELATALGVNHIHLNGVLTGRIRPSVFLALRIEKETGGAIKATKLRPDIKKYL
jgi:DNA-binding transcriptional regulator YdaS (Cro superfamily)